ncbi:MAG: phage late control D family protein [Polyangiaceae bacterium]|nr:phage late control D family protein [Polyangiaceae bacterium]
MAIVELSFGCGDDSLSVRSFAIEEELSKCFEIALTARSPNPDLALSEFVGEPALFRMTHSIANAVPKVRVWSGVVRDMAQVRVEPDGLTTYELTLVPALWLLTQRRNQRLFQHVAIPDIVERVLAEWNIEPVWRIARDTYPRLELRTQYNESDYHFLSRLLEEAGISFYF